MRDQRQLRAGDVMLALIKTMFYRAVGRQRVTFYQYKNCDSCRKARKFLKARGIEFEAIDITVQPPSVDELTVMLDHQNGELRKLFNTSGLQYRELEMKDRLPNMSKDEALALLASNGKLIKRPFLLSGDVGLVGFKEAEWDNVLASQLAL